MFFYLSKILWFLIDPGNILLMLLLAGSVLSWTRWRSAGHKMLLFSALAALLVSVLPVGKGMLITLENRFPANYDLPQKVDGIIALGGIVDQVMTRSRGRTAIGSGVERLTELAALSRQYPDAKLIFTGGSGALLNQSIKEADVLEPLLTLMGIEQKRMIYENKSRNTYENAILTKILVDPQPGENWILITSAFHMPRSVGVFRKAGWTIIPYPVDYFYGPEEPLRPFFSLPGGLGKLSTALHEWLGLAFYRLTGKTDHFFPGP